MVAVETTLGALLARRSLDLRHVAGPLDPDRRVRWVAVSELADPTPYLEGGELLLTTGLELPVGDPDAVAGYVERIRRRGVVALGLGTGVRHDVPPPSLVAAAEEAGLPLLDVPPPTPFIAVTRAVADLVAQAERDDVTRSLDAHRRLTRAALRGDGPDAIVRELARLIDGWATVTDTAGAVLSSAGGPPRALTALVAEEVARLSPQGLRGASSVSVADGSLVVHPLGVAGAPRGYLAAGRSAAFGRPARSAIAASVSLLSLALQRAEAAGSERRRVLGVAAELLIGGRTEAADAVLAALGGDAPGPDDLVAILASAGAGEPALPAGSLTVVVGGELISLVPATRADDTTRALRDAGPVGVSRPVRRAGVPGAVAEARAARATATNADAVVPFADVLAGGVPALVDEAAARTWAEQLLAPLRADSGADLVGALRTWLAHHGQLQPAAAELGVHRHTLRHRMARVEELLGRPLASPQTRMDLWFALQRL
jgi:PucR family transcriptional regulator, purine catabolism regulatory protein